MEPEIKSYINSLKEFKDINAFVDTIAEFGDALNSFMEEGTTLTVDHYRIIINTISSCLVQILILHNEVEDMKKSINNTKNYAYRANFNAKSEN